MSYESKQEDPGFRWFKVIVLAVALGLAIGLTIRISSDRATRADSARAQALSKRINSLIANDPRFEDVEAHEFSYGQRHVMVGGSVASEADLKALYEIILAEPPPSDFKLMRDVIVKMAAATAGNKQ